MTTFRHALLMTATAAIALAVMSPDMAGAQAKKPDDKAAAPLKNVIGEVSDGEALYVDGNSFQLAKGKAKGKDDPTVLIQKLRAVPLPQGAIIFRAGDKLYLAGAAPAAMMVTPAAYQTGVSPAAYQTGVPGWAYMQPGSPAAYQTGVPGWAYMQSVSPAAYQTGVPGWAYMQSVSPAAYQTGVPPWAYMQPVSPAAYQTGVPPGAYMQPVSPAAYQTGVSPAAYQTGVNPGAYMRNSFDENFSW